MSDTGERSEKATDKRMKEVHAKGQLSRSTDLSAWIGVGVAALMVPTTISAAAAAGTDQLMQLHRIVAHPTLQGARDAMTSGLGSLAATLGPILGVTAVAVLVVAVAQGGVHIKRMTGNYEQFNVLKGITRVFGTQALWSGAKSLLKTSVVGLVLWSAIQALVPVVMTSGSLSVSAIIDVATGGAGSLLRAAVAAGLLLAAADVFVVIRRNRKKTRMTKKEVKDEHKSSDGDPHVKSQRRSRQMAMSRNRMMGAIATADVVLTNPTHVAIAVCYVPGRSAPRVVAKGAGQVAQKIRERAEAERVPIVRDVPLARALHAACDLGDEIPVDLYTPVARVLSFVMALKARGMAAGTHVAPRPTSAAEVAAIVPAAMLTGDVLPKRHRPREHGRPAAARHDGTGSRGPTSRATAKATATATATAPRTATALTTAPAGGPR